MSAHIFTRNDENVVVAIGANEKENQYLCIACGQWFTEEQKNSNCAFVLDGYFDYGPVPCPTCNKVGIEPCVRGRYPSPVWDRQEPYPEGHNSRKQANKGLTYG